MDGRLKKQLGERIKARRVELGLSQQELAEKIGKSSAAYIAYIEGGDRNIASADLMRLAKILNTTVSELFGESSKDLSFSEALRSVRGLSELDREKIEDFYFKVRGNKFSDLGFDNSEFEPRYKLSQEKAVYVWKNICNEKIPIVLNEVVQALGVKVQGLSISSSGYSRVDSDGVCIIVYNSKESRFRQRFTVAHEIGHLLLEHISIDGSTMQHSHNSQEKEADMFAGELLVPGEHLRKFMKDGTRTIDDIIDQYQVSKEAATVAILRNNLLNKVKI